MAVLILGKTHIPMRRIKEIYKYMDKTEVVPTSLKSMGKQAFEFFDNLRLGIGVSTSASLASAYDDGEASKKVTMLCVRTYDGEIYRHREQSTGEVDALLKQFDDYVGKK